MQIATLHPLPQDLGPSISGRTEMHGFGRDDGFAAIHEEPPLTGNAASV